jgi:prevent-host-death family protein
MLITARAYLLDLGQQVTGEEDGGTVLKLSQLVERAEGGEDIVIARNGKPAARLVPIRSASALTSVRGAWRGRVHLAEDFDELPDDITDALGGK